MSMQEAELIKKIFREVKGARVFLVGGALRDALLHRKTKDFDFVVTGISREKLEARLRTFGQVDLTGKHFGVFKFLPNNFSTDEPLDISLPRTEKPHAESVGGYRDFDMQIDPQISIEDDLSRRDFTINAMALDLQNEKLIDPFGGQADLAARIIRAVNDPRERFAEDLSRLLRALRFAVQLSFEIEQETWSALQEAAPKLNAKSANAIWIVPREIVAREIANMFSINAGRALQLLTASGIFSQLFPEASLPTEDELMFASNDVTLVLALLLKNSAPSEASSRVRSLAFHTLPWQSVLHVDPSEVGWLVHQMQLAPKTRAQLVKGDAAEFERAFLLPRGRRLLALWLSQGFLREVKAAKARMEKIFSLWPEGRTKKIPPLVSGEDVMALGIPPGPRVRELLQKVRSAQLDGKISTKVAARMFLKDL